MLLAFGITSLRFHNVVAWRYNNIWWYSHIDLKSKRKTTSCTNLDSFYILVANSQPSSSSVALVANLNIFHQRFAHVSSNSIKYMAYHGVVHSMRISPSNNKDASVGCLYGKGHRAPISNSSSTKSTRVLELVHSDILGSLEVLFVVDSHYIILFIDKFSN